MSVGNTYTDNQQHLDTFAPRARSTDRSYRVGSLYNTTPATPEDNAEGSEEEESEEEEEEGVFESYAHENRLDENHAHGNELEYDAPAAGPHVRDSTGAEKGLRTGPSRTPIGTNQCGTGSAARSPQIPHQRPPTDIPSRTGTTPETTKTTSNAGSLTTPISPVRSVGETQSGGEDDTRVRTFTTFV